MPLVGDVLGHTLSPIVSRVIWPLLMAKIFGPRSVPKKFEGFPKEMALRPSQIRASAAESALMIPDAIHFRDEYANLKMPVVIVAGDEDRLVDIDAQSRGCTATSLKVSFIAFPKMATWSIRLRPMTSCLPSTKWLIISQPTMAARTRGEPRQSGRLADRTLMLDHSGPWRMSLYGEQ